MSGGEGPRARQRAGIGAIANRRLRPTHSIERIKTVVRRPRRERRRGAPSTAARRGSEQSRIAA